jgi:hypothetical protein
MRSANQRVTEYLAADHARLHALLERACAPGSFDHAAFASFRAGLLRHIGIEEKLLFPAVRSAHDGEHLEAARALRVEHAAIASLLVPTPDLALAREIASLLAQHDAREEGADGVYEQCELILGEARSRVLAERAIASGEVPVARHFDGPNVHRTAAAALAAALAAGAHPAQRSTPPRRG